MSDEQPFDDRQAEFLRIIAEGGTWRKAQRELKVAPKTISAWIADDEEFGKQYARACDIRADALFEEILEIADDGSNDWMERNYGDDARWTENGEAIRRSVLRIDARKWVLGKMKPKVYGDKAAVEVAGPGGGAIAVKVKWDDGSDDQDTVSS